MIHFLVLGLDRYCLSVHSGCPWCNFKVQLKCNSTVKKYSNRKFQSQISHVLKNFPTVVITIPALIFKSLRASLICLKVLMIGHILFTQSRMLFLEFSYWFQCWQYTIIATENLSLIVEFPTVSPLFQKICLAGCSYHCQFIEEQLLSDEPWDVVSLYCTWKLKVVCHLEGRIHYTPTVSSRWGMKIHSQKQCSQWASSADL